MRLSPVKNHLRLSPTPDPRPHARLLGQARVAGPHLGGHVVVRSGARIKRKRGAAQHDAPASRGDIPEGREGTVEVDDGRAVRDAREARAAAFGRQAVASAVRLDLLGHGPADGRRRAEGREERQQCEESKHGGCVFEGVALSGGWDGGWTSPRALYSWNNHSTPP